MLCFVSHRMSFPPGWRIMCNLCCRLISVMLQFCRGHCTHASPNPDQAASPTTTPSVVISNIIGPSPEVPCGHQVVWICGEGAVWHVEGCRYISDKAKAKAYRGCSVCCKKKTL
jgi:hypothetical protein